jgi:demethoxyubiquinone hydroxylase (CLK1/Coq7/Cat5 family)
VENRVEKKDFDISVIRPEMHLVDLKLRGQGMPSDRLKRIKEGLQTLHTLETMAANIYKFQITRKKSELNLQLIAAMGNEMTHLQDCQIKLFEYGFKPSMLRWLYWMVGFKFGFFSRLLGTKAILKTGIWVEKKAVRHYDELLGKIEWDEDTRKIIEKDQADEYGHIKRWEAFLKKSKV